MTHPRIFSGGLQFKATLRDGTAVLGKLYHGSVTAMTYANRTQAYAAAARVGGIVIQRGRPFYVMLPTMNDEGVRL